ncbi:phage tail tip fiber protein [Pantoea allii]|uniref:phage tail tip fiber protein n=1 Tax=Pantoea allii TaxID=574096 RepID=UPI0024B657FC|nr:DUF1983 domain-containing protein [Pantoea allii]MDJ0087723.1 DUF1983 domain-containing protein [Pantoea allii]
MPAAIPVVAAVAGGIAVANQAYAIALVITVAAQVASQALAKKPSLDGYRDAQERKQVLRAAASAKTVVYGRSLSAGTLFFSEEQEGDQTDGELLHLAITLAGHPITSIGAVYLGDDDISTYGDKASYEVHIDRQTADPYMLENAPSWKSDMIGKGISWLRVTLRFDSEKFPSGIPNITVEKLGRKVYDPRNGATNYSNNAALCILDYYRSYLKVPDADINWDQFKEAANISDEIVSGADGQTERRYTINGEFDMSENKASILESMLSACSGEATYIAGKHGILVGAYYGPASEVISESQLAGDIEIMPEVSQAERVNTVKGTFNDPQQRFAEVDFPAVSVSDWVAEDGVEISQDLKLRFVTSEFQAQRLADIKLKRTRISRTLNVTLNLSGYRYRPGMYVKVNFPSLGIINVEMRVTDWKFGVQNGVQLTLKQETSEVWGDAIGKPIERPPFTQLPTDGVAQPQNLKYTVEEIGQVVQGILSWQNVGQFAYNQVLIKKDGQHILSVQVPGSFTRLTGLVRGLYTAHVVAVGYSGATSPEALLDFNIAAPDAPSTVDVAMGYFQATLTPRIPQIQNVSTQFDFWTSGETALPNSNTDTVEGNATRLYMGNQYTTDNNLQVDHTYHYYVRTINAFGSSAFIHVSFVYTFSSAGLIDYIDEQLRKSETVQNLNQSAEDNYQAIIENALANDGDVQQKYKSLDYMGMKITASYTEITNLIVKNDQAYAQRFEQLQSSINSTSATVQVTSSALATLNNQLSAQWGVKLQLNTSTGNRYVAGIQLGLEANGGAVQSIFAVRSDVFAVYNPSNNTETLAFAIKNGQVFLSEGIFDYASITLAKIGSWYSSNYVAGKSGTIMRNDGSFEMYGDNGSSGGVVINSTGIACYDTNGVERTKLGKLF